MARAPLPTITVEDEVSEVDPEQRAFRLATYEGWFQYPRTSRRRLPDVRTVVRIEVTAHKQVQRLRTIAR